MTTDIPMPAADRLHVVTGGPGAGKSTLIAALAAAGVATSAEVGRQIIREQVASCGDALPWADERAFAEAMTGREIAAREAALASGATVVLDRGIPDVIGFLRLSDLDVPPISTPRRGRIATTRASSSLPSGRRSSPRMPSAGRLPRSPRPPRR